MYRVVIWDTDEILDEFKHLPSAKRVARNQGHNGEVAGKWLRPVARVDSPMQDGSEGFGVEYNPKFRVGKDENFKPVPYARRIIPGHRKCMHGLYHGCKKGCN